LRADAAVHFLANTGTYLPGLKKKKEVLGFDEVLT